MKVPSKSIMRFIERMRMSIAWFEISRISICAYFELNGYSMRPQRTLAGVVMKFAEFGRKSSHALTLPDIFVNNLVIE